MSQIEKFPPLPALSYRRDLDGLRALAVLAVVAAHAKLPWFEGGFVGVDVFFVLSGYLITSIMARDIELGRFSFVSFYERRARRLLPALFFMLVSITAAGFWLYPPWQYDYFAKTMAATAVFSSNIQLMVATGDYFSAGAEVQPLLHTWSLAVEEQFYFFFPPLLLLAYRWGRKLAVWMLSGLCFVSFLFAVLTVSTNQTAAFFLPHLRAWEMGAGALLAMLALPQIGSARWASCVGLAGLGMIVGCIVFYDKMTPFPGLAALPVVLGTLMLIHSGQTTGGAASRLFSTSPTVAVGKISYSLYLWHWPPIVAVHTYAGGEPSPLLVTGAVVVAFLAAWISWRFIEAPFRGAKGEARYSRRFVFRLTAVATGIGLLAATAIATTDGISRRLPEGVQTTYAEAKRMSDLDRACRLSDIDDRMSFCSIGVEGVGTAPRVLVWGDSHAGAWLAGFDDWLGNSGLSGTAFVKSGCPPLLNLRRIGMDGGEECRKWNQGVLNWLEGSQIDTVILAARWSISYHGSRVGREPGDPIQVSWRNGGEYATGADAVEKALGDSLVALRAAGKDVWVLGSVPELGWNAPQKLLDSAFFSGNVDLESPTRSIVEVRLKPVDSMLKEIAVEHDAWFFPVYNHFCGEICMIMEEGKLFYRDDDHLSPHGARVMLPKVLGSPIQ